MTDEEKLQPYYQRHDGEAAVRRYVHVLSEVGVTYELGEYVVAESGLSEDKLNTHQVISQRGETVYTGPEHCCEWFADEANLFYAKYLMTKGTMADNNPVSRRYRR